MAAMAKKSPASILKSKGLIPKEWDLRSLSRGQKSWVTKLTQKAHERVDKKTGEIKQVPRGKFADVVLKPKEFSTIKAAGKKRQAQARAAGLPTANNRALVHTGKGGKVRRRGDKLEINDATGRKIEVWFANSDNFQRAYEKARKRKLKRNQVWAFHIGNRVNNVQYQNLDDLMFYLTEKDDWHSDGATDYISLVLITEGRPDVIAHNTYGGDDDED